jgi:hypothetical protein
MKPMAPMAPMKPMERWWPDQFGNPASAGSQNGLRYAFFRDQRRLVVERAGTLTVYDTGDHDIGGVSQATEQAASVEFTSQLGPVRLGELRVVG